MAESAALSAKSEAQKLLVQVRKFRDLASELAQTKYKTESGIVDFAQITNSDVEELGFDPNVISGSDLGARIQAFLDAFSLEYEANNSGVDLKLKAARIDSNG